MTRREMQGFLAWSALPGVGARTLRALLDHARESRRSLVELWEMPASDLHLLVPLAPRSRGELERHAHERWEQAGSEAEAVEASGVDLLLAAAPDAPAALRPLERDWPYLFAYGALELLDEPRVALLNSRDVSNHGLIVTDALADALARRDVTLVASINRDSYKAAATAAKRHAGPAILVLDRGIATVFPEGITREPVAPARVWDESFDPGLQLLLSSFGWREPWHPRAGPRRDALIIDLADVLVAVDIRPGGNIEQECLRAARAGKRVAAIDRGAPAEGAPLWEREPGIRRIPWKGAEDAIPEVLVGCRGQRADLWEERAERGRQAEIAAFLARACRRIGEDRRPIVASVPASGALAETARAWSSDQRAAAPPDWILADLASAPSGPFRPGELLERVAPGGLCACLVPAAWLDSESHAAARAAWLSRGALQLVARLPRPDASAEATAALILRKGAAGPVPAPVFEPEREPLTRFELRRYLREVLRGL